MTRRDDHDSIGRRHDRLTSATPVDRLAARVLQPGIHFDPNMRSLGEDYYHAIVPPPEAPRPVHNTWDDLRGMRVGRLTVVGWLGKLKGKKGRWSVRCDCGFYEIRKTPALHTAAVGTDRCCECEYLEKVKAGRGHALPQAPIKC